MIQVVCLHSGILVDLNECEFQTDTDTTLGETGSSVQINIMSRRPSRTPLTESATSCMEPLPLYKEVLPLIAKYIIHGNLPSFKHLTGGRGLALLGNQTNLMNIYRLRFSVTYTHYTAHRSTQL